MDASLNFISKVNNDGTLTNLKVFLLAKDGTKTLVEDNSDLDLDFSKLIDIPWSIVVKAVRDNHCNLGIQVNDFDVESEIEVDLETVDDNMAIKSLGDSYTKFNVKFEVKNIEVQYDQANPFTDDFCPTNFEYEINKIEQISDSEFLMTINKPILTF